MKLTFLILVINVSFSLASVYSQNQKISLQVENKSFSDVINEIEQLSDYSFLYSNDDISKVKTLTFSFKNTVVSKIIERCLENTNLEYSFKDDVIVIKSVEKNNFEDSEKQQEIKIITGTVISSEDKLPVPGVNVYIKGSTIGTVTDLDGKYSISVPENSETLVFSAVGFKTTEIEISESSNINITLQVEEISIDEVMVVGFGTQRKRDLTGALSKIEIGDETSNNSPSFEMAIQGNTPGVFIGQASGKLGETITMRIRGASSVSANNQPLYVVDGLPITSESQGVLENTPTSPLVDINFNDIESIQILKDASATAIYGSRASNGVVLITTKKGKAGKTMYNLNVSTGYNTPSQLREWCNAEEYLTLIDESINNVIDPETGLFDNWKTPDELKDIYIPGWRDNNDEDWQQEALRNGLVKKINFSSSGGNEKNTYYTGLSYDDQEGIIIGNDLNKISGKLRLDHKANDYISFGLNTSIIRTKLNRVTSDNTWANPMQLVAIPPVQSVIDPETGEYNTNTVYYNGLISYRDAYNKTNVYRTFFNAYLNLNIYKGLSFRSEFGGDLLNQNEKSYYGRETNWGKPQGEGQTSEVSIQNYNTNNYFTYDLTSEENHLNVVLGMSFQEESARGSSIGAKGFPTDDFQNLSNASEVTAFGEWGYANSYLSYFARTNYQFKNKYLVSLSGRIDGSSRFGDDNKYGFFPAGSLGWIISEEEFLKNIKSVSFLKIRASYGVTGNSGIGNYESYGLYDGTSYVGIPALIPSQLESSNLKWETTKQLNLGIDFGLFNDRVSGGIDYYNKQTTDLLLYRSLPTTSGFSSVTQNVGSLKNYGVEFAIKTHNFKGKFKWITDFNISFNRNEVIDIDGPEISYGVNYVIEGEDIGVFKLVEYAGVHPMTGDALFYLNDGSGNTTNNYNEAKRVVVGSPNPDFVGGLNNRFEFKNFDLSVLLNFVYGNEVYLSGGRYQSANYEWWDNQTKDQLDRWQNPGDITDVPEPRFGEPNGSQHSTRYLYDGSYLRIKNMTFGYNLPKSLLGKVKLEKVRIYFSTSNLYTFTNYPGYDPEVNSLAAGASTQAYNVMMGVDYYTAPQIRSYLMGIDINF